MIQTLLALPTLVGITIVVGLTVFLGLVIYLVSHRLIAAGYPFEEMKDAAGSMFRVVGMLVSLFLSLTFADVLIELNALQKSVHGETNAVADTYSDLFQFGVEETGEARQLLLDYTRAVIDDDWPSLREDRLGDRATALLRQLETAVLNLEATDTIKENMWARIIANVDLISDFRVSRLQQALAQPPFFLIVVLFGFFVTMVCFGLYRPIAPLVVLVTLYVFFVGLVVYLILAFSDPFQGVPGVDATPLEYAISRMEEYEQCIRASTAEPTLAACDAAKP